MPSNRPIGIFDSGMGGLSVYQRVHERLPTESIIYVADSRFLPYGDRPTAIIQERALVISQYLVDQGAKALVVACNTATAAAVHEIRSAFDLPIIGMEPGLKPAINLTSSGKVAILATSNTLESEKFNHLKARHTGHGEVSVVPCPGWVELVEQPSTDVETKLNLIRERIQPQLELGVDTLVLGCTHFTFLSELIRQVAGPSVKLIDTGQAVARHLNDQLLKFDLLADQTEAVNDLFYATQVNAHTEEVCTSLLQRPCGFQPLEL